MKFIVLIFFFVLFLFPVVLYSKTESELPAFEEIVNRLNVDLEINANVTPSIPVGYGDRFC